MKNRLSDAIFFQKQSIISCLIARFLSLRSKRPCFSQFCSIFHSNSEDLNGFFCFSSPPFGSRYLQMWAPDAPTMSKSVQECILRHTWGVASPEKGENRVSTRSEHLKKLLTLPKMSVATDTSSCGRRKI